MRKNILLNENQTKQIVKSILLEQELGGGSGGSKWITEPGPGKLITKTVMRPMVMNANLFANGVDTINTNSTEFKRGIDSIKSALLKTKNLQVTIEGGASAVGSSNGYDNKKLAERRATNFMNSVKSLFPNVKFTIKTKVGVATVKNSPEAQSEQYVKLFFTVSEETTRLTQAVDNTSVAINDVNPQKITNGKKKVSFMVSPNRMNDFIKYVRNFK